MQPSNNEGYRAVTSRNRAYLGTEIILKFNLAGLYWMMSIQLEIFQYLNNLKHKPNELNHNENKIIIYFRPCFLFGRLF